MVYWWIQVLMMMVDSGTHDELIQRNVDYRNLFGRFSKLPPLKLQE